MRNFKAVIQKSGRGRLWEVATFISDFTGKILIFWKVDRLRELVAHGRSTEFHFKKKNLWSNLIYSLFKDISKSSIVLNI